MREVWGQGTEVCWLHSDLAVGWDEGVGNLRGCLGKGGVTLDIYDDSSRMLPWNGEGKRVIGKTRPLHCLQIYISYLYLHFLPSEHALSLQFCTHMDGSSSDLSSLGTVSSLNRAACLLTFLPIPLMVGRTLITTASQLMAQCNHLHAWILSELVWGVL